MIMPERDAVGIAKKILDSLNSYNITTTLNFERGKSKLSKEKAAAAFISHEAFKVSGNLENTIIKTYSNITGGVNYSISNKPLSYRAMVAVMCKLSLDGFVVCDIANVAMSKDKSMVAVEELNIPTDILRVSVEDELRCLVAQITDEALKMTRDYYKIFKIHIMSLLEPERNKMIIDEQIVLTDNIEDRYYLEMEDVKLNVVETRNTVYVISGHDVTILNGIVEVDTRTLVKLLKEKMRLEDYESTVILSPPIFAI